MADAFSRAVPLLERDVVATLGEAYRQMVLDAAALIVSSELPRRADSLVERVQQEIHDTFVDTTWPACPRHARHPLWYHDDGSWWCEHDRAALCKLGDLGELKSPPKARG